MTSRMFPARRRQATMALMATVAALGALLARPTRAGDDFVQRGAGLREESLASVSGGVSARVVSGLEIVKTRDVEIGAVRAGVAGGSVTLAPDASRTSRGGASLVASASGPASFRVLGVSDPARLKVTLPARVVLSRVGGGETLVTRDFVGRIAGCLAADCGGSTLTLDVGLTLDIGPDQAPGRYVGTFTVTVNES
jgi:hypothetical protein